MAETVETVKRAVRDGMKCNHLWLL